MQFRGMALGDNGGGPVTPNTTLIKETGAQAEIAWVVDDRSRCVRTFARGSGCHLTHKLARQAPGTLRSDTCKNYTWL